MSYYLSKISDYFIPRVVATAYTAVDYVSQQNTVASIQKNLNPDHSTWLEIKKKATNLNDPLIKAWHNAYRAFKDIVTQVLPNTCRAKVSQSFDCVDPLAETLWAKTLKSNNAALTTLNSHIKAIVCKPSGTYSIIVESSGEACTYTTREWSYREYPSAREQILAIGATKEYSNDSLVPTASVILTAEGLPALIEKVAHSQFAANILMNNVADFVDSGVCLLGYEQSSAMRFVGKVVAAGAVAYATGASVVPFAIGQATSWAVRKFFFHTR